jgi:hypothetical protein
MKQILGLVKIMMAFILIVLGLWIFDYLKQHNKDFNISTITTTTTKNVESQKLLSQIYTTPVSYVVNDEKSILIDLTNMNLFLLKNGEIYKTIKVLHKGPSNL